MNSGVTFDIEARKEFKRNLSMLRPAEVDLFDSIGICIMEVL